MAYFTRNRLLEYARGTQKARLAESVRASARSASTPSVFLSHSHADKDIVEPAANFLATLGVIVYIDWMDPEMPSVTNSNTAKRIREMIQLNRRFLVLATERSLESRWVPWELGYADGEKKFTDIAILPVSESLYRTAPNEYIQVYQRIEEADQGGWYVFQPGQDRSHTAVRDWLRA